MRVYVKGINALLPGRRTRPHKPWTHPRRDRPERDQERAVRRGRRRRGGRGASSSTACRTRSAPTRATRSGTTCASARTRRRPCSIKGNFPYAPLPANRTGNVVLDNGSFQPVPVAGGSRRGGRARASSAPHASNVLMVAGKRSRSGHPLFVGGPQIGYFYPGLTLEMDLHGPGWNARGATSAPFPGYILIGRREDFVWTLTSAGADIVDHYVETLCGGSDTKYLYRGQCRDMAALQRRHARRPAGDVQPDRARARWSGYATVDGRRVAVSRKRSSYLLRRRGPADLPATHARARPERARRSSRWRRPLRRRSTRSTRTTSTSRNHHRPAADAGARRGPGPARRTARATSSGAASSSRGQHPHGDPDSGVMNNWNNKPARGFPAADDQWALRVDRPRRPAERQHGQGEASTRSRRSPGAMNAAATQDVRAMKFVPVLARAPEGRHAAERAGQPDARAARGRGGRRAAAGWTATSTARSTIPARRSSTRPGTGSRTRR